MRNGMRRALVFTIFPICAILLSPLSSTHHARWSLAAKAMPSAAEIYVDAQSGSDSNSGSRSRPLKSLSRAAEAALANYRRNISAIVVLQPGTYRESVLLTAKPDTSTATITFQASTLGTAVISGADAWTGWKESPVDSRSFVHDWPFEWGLCPTPQGWPSTIPEIVRHREMIFINGVFLNQVLSYSELSDDSFYVNETDHTVTIRSREGVDVTKATVEVSVRPKLFESHGISGLTFRGLSFQKADSCLAESAFSVYSSANTLVEDSSFLWNNWHGIHFGHVTDSMARRIVADHNGGSGIRGHMLRGVTYEDDEASFNNWRGARGDFYHWDDAGAKFGRAHDTLVLRFRAFANQTMGLWFDTDDARVTVKDSALFKNQLDGLKLEANQGPIAIEDSRICNNGAHGVFALNSDMVKFSGDVIFGNRSGQIFVDGRRISRTSPDWETNSPNSPLGHNLKITRSTIVSADEGQLLMETSQAARESSVGFFATIFSDFNTWYSPSNERVFQFDPGGPGHTPRDITFSEWQSKTGQDRNSKFEPPASDPAVLCEVKDNGS
jgi:hypothetical protein